MGNASFLEASRRSWKEGGAISESEYKGTESVKSGGSWAARGLLVVFCFFFFLVALVCGEAVREATRSSHQGRRLEALLCRLCRANLRVCVRSAGESSPAPRLAQAQPRLS